MIFVIGERLRKLRKDRRMSQEELAAVLGVNNSAISLYESNKNDPSDTIKVEIARFFDVSLDYLLGLTEVQVSYYRENKFLSLPDSLNEEELKLLSEFCQFISTRRS